MTPEALTADIAEAGVAVVRLERPRLGRGFAPQAMALLERLEHDPGVRAVVLTGRGDVFSAGMDARLLDLYVPGRPDPPELNEVVRAFGALHRRSKPVLAAINGYCLGGGLELALACDIRFAADHCVDARGLRVESFLGFPEVRLGICTGLGGATALARLVGDGLALEMLLSGDPISARRALSIGLVNEICPRDALLDRTLALARCIARNAVQAVSGFRALVRERHLTAMGSVIEREFGRFKATRPTDRAVAAGQGGA